MKFVKGGTTTPEQPKQPEQPNQGAIGDYYINASALNVRSGEGTNYRIIGALPQGQKVQVISENSGWSKINYNGQTGYIGTRYLSKTPVGGAVDNKPNNNQNNNQNNKITTITTIQVIIAATVLLYLHMQKECKAYHTFGAELLLTVWTAVATSTTYLRNLVITLAVKVLRDIGVAYHKLQIHNQVT